MSGIIKKNKIKVSINNNKIDIDKFAQNIVEDINVVHSDINGLRSQINSLSSVGVDEIWRLIESVDQIKKELDGYKLQIEEIIDTKGKPNGIAPLDSNGEISGQYISSEGCGCREYETIENNEVSVGDCVCLLNDNYIKIEP